MMNILLKEAIQWKIKLRLPKPATKYKRIITEFGDLHYPS